MWDPLKGYIRLYGPLEAATVIVDHKKFVSV